MKKVWFCEQGERCMFIICDVVFSSGKRAKAGRAIWRDEWSEWGDAQATLMEHHIKCINYDILQIGAL